MKLIQFGAAMLSALVALCVFGVSQAHAQRAPTAKTGDTIQAKLLNGADLSHATDKNPLPFLFEPVGDYWKDCRFLGMGYLQQGETPRAVIRLQKVVCTRGGTAIETIARGTVIDRNTQITGLPTDGFTLRPTDTVTLILTESIPEIGTVGKAGQRKGE